MQKSAHKSPPLPSQQVKRARPLCRSHRVTHQAPKAACSPDAEPRTPKIDGLDFIGDSSPTNASMADQHRQGTHASAQIPRPSSGTSRLRTSTDTAPAASVDRDCEIVRANVRNAPDARAPRPPRTIRQPIGRTGSNRHLLTTQHIFAHDPDNGYSMKTLPTASQGDRLSMFVRHPRLGRLVLGKQGLDEAFELSEGDRNFLITHYGTDKLPEGPIVSRPSLPEHGRKSTNPDQSQNGSKRLHLGRTKSNRHFIDGEMRPRTKVPDSSRFDPQAVTVGTSTMVEFAGLISI